MASDRVAERRNRADQVLVFHLARRDRLRSSGRSNKVAMADRARLRMRMIQAIFWNSIKGACDKEGWLKDLGTVEERCDFPIWVDVPIPVDWAAKARLLEFDPRKAGP